MYEIYFVFPNNYNQGAGKLTTGGLIWFSICCSKLAYMLSTLAVL